MSEVKKFKQGTNVKFVRKNGEKVTGRVSGYEEKGNGLWALVNTAEKGSRVPTITKVRHSQLLT